MGRKRDERKRGGLSWFPKIYQQQTAESEKRSEQSTKKGKSDIVRGGLLKSWSGARFEETTTIMNTCSGRR